MSTTITISISVTGDEAYTEREQAILNSLNAHPSQGAAAVVPASKPAPAAAPKAEPKAAPAPAPKAEKPAPAPSSPQSTKAAVLDTTIEDAPAAVEAEEVEEDLVGGEDFTLQDAVTRATKLVSEKKQAIVKDALTALGAKRVSDLKEQADINAFMTAVEGK